ncbi:helix-turn-helix transcriptional regulator [Saccharothrix sp. ST-888]|uniref:helix-turn-helix transcriptional regulator n=1 Tax=Saccharothrix sp. ST-888 TaxID=1427391 RepID=UPI0005ED0929|nr:LuxR family transcriptional regulator [Saccharothrix sp. ST-888]KJK59108.1 LuxR family transcriptional regulator [Saccharothrix sp. ST-888]
MAEERQSPALVGRQRETELLASAVAQAEGNGVGSALLLRGEAGVGKSTLLAWAERAARERGFTVLRAVGAEAETDFSFGSLHQALWSLLQRSKVLSAHQREALESAFGARAGTPSGFAVGAATLALLAEAAQAAPVLLALDDLHWIDSSSATVFAFLRRRCAELPLVIVGAGRPDGPAAQTWSADPVDVAGLPPADATALLAACYPELAAATTDRVLAEAAGNPLALVELPRQLADAQRRGIAPLPDRLPLGRNLERMFAERLGAVTPAAARLLLMGALATGTDFSSRVPQLGAGFADALERIEADGLARLDAGGRLVFRHPLVRTAVISAASDAERRAAHRALAGSLPQQDPRRLVHEAAAAQLPEEGLAHRLQEVGRGLAARGGDAEGALLLERAAALSPDPADRARRLTWAAVMAARGGQLRHTAALVEELKAAPVPTDVAPLFAYAVVYADQSHHIDFASSATLLPGVLDRLTAPGADTFGLVEQAFFKLLLAATYTDDPWAWRALERHREHVSEAGRLCLRAWTDPGPGVAEALRAVTAGMTQEQEAGAAWLLLWTASALDSPEGDLWRRSTGLHSYATQGSVAKAKCHQDYLLGHWDQAEVCRREAEIADELGYHCNALMFRQYHAHFLAGRGDEAGLREVERIIRPAATRARMRFVLDRLAHLRGLAALAHGRYEEAYALFGELTPPGRLAGGPPWHHALVFDLVTAAVYTGRREEARAHVAAGAAAGSAEISGRHAFLLAAAAALAAEDEEAEAAYQRAYAVPGAERWVFDLARLRLAHGSWLRRRHRPGAREVLRAAHHAFRRLRAEPWARRCEEELRAAGDSVAPPTSPEAAGLTGQELRIARLAATGLSNKEIGQLLQLSPRTVGAHLYKVFPKLGITSRAALGHALGGD